MWLEAIILLALYLYQLAETESRRIQEGGYLDTGLSLGYIIVHPTWSPITTFMRLVLVKIVHYLARVTKYELSDPELKFRRITRHF